MRNTTTFSIPTERGQQLRELARFHKLSVSDLIARYIDQDLARTGLGAQIPGVRLLLEETVVRFGFENLEIALESAARVEAVAKCLQLVAEGSIIELEVIENNHVQVTRRGIGVAVEIRCGRDRVRRVFAKNVASALAKELQVAAKRLRLSEPQ